ncbi:MAG: AN1-type zinc finger domain-containing protein [Nitrososphaerota archaeon]|nr:hypothetical protein [Aigarchaeota archaeon]MDW8076782.1 AN1-type zinc finger domain-containing protein [Nitrososphaerota archaeon]
MTDCMVCGKKELLPYRCSYCGGYFCGQHRLPEQHDCPAIKYPFSYRKVDFSLDKRNLEHKPPKSFGMYGVEFMRAETFQLILATLLVLAVGYSFTAYNVLSPESSLLAIGFAASFLVHELAHKLSARRYGIYAEFRLNASGVLLTMISLVPFLPIKFIAPGAVHLSGFIDKDLMGKVAIPGPLSNLIMSIALLIMSLLGFSRYVTYGIALANAWIAFFNLLPFEPFDGAKVIKWSFKVWVLMFGSSLSLFAVLVFMF